MQVSHQKMKALPPPVINIATYQTITRCKQWRFREVLITVEECDAKTLPRANIVLNKCTSYRVPQREFSDRKKSMVNLSAVGSQLSEQSKFRVS